jgi:hypothetical protein
LFRAHQSIHEGFPPVQVLNLVEEAVALLRVLILRKERVVRLGHQAETRLLRTVKTVAKEVQAQNVLARDLVVQKPLHDLKHVK